MTQKVLKVGSSAAVTIPKKSLKELGIKIGDPIFVYTDDKNRRVVYSKRKINDFELFTQRNLEIIEWTRKFIERYRTSLENLAKE